MHKNKPIKVLHILAKMSPGGAEMWLMNLLRAVDKTRIHMDFCELGSTRGSLVPEINHLGSQVHSCPIKPFVSFKKDLSDYYMKIPMMWYIHTSGASAVY